MEAERPMGVLRETWGRGAGFRGLGLRVLRDTCPWRRVEGGGFYGSGCPWGHSGTPAPGVGWRVEGFRVLEFGLGFRVQGTANSARCPLQYMRECGRVA